MIPLQVFWEVEDALRLAQFYSTTGNESGMAQAAHRKILRRLMKYVIHEKDRLIIQGQLNGSL